VLSINAYAPVIQQSENSFHERLSAIEGETFTMSIDRGFNTAKFMMTGEVEYLKSWFANGLARDIVFKGPHGQIIWNGYVSQLSLAEGHGTRSKSIGEMNNRVVLTYRPIDGSNVVGAQTSTTVNNTTSQGVYGIKVGTVGGGELLAATATAEANAHLTAMSKIAVDEKVTTASKVPSLQVGMRGYSYMSDWFTYSAGAGNDTISNVIAAILAADPNSILSTVTTDIDTNSTSTSTYYDGKVRGWKAISELAGMGDSSGNLWAAAIYEGRRTIYKAKEWVDDVTGVALASNKYLPLERQVTDPGFRIIDEAGREIAPWDVRPDRLLYTTGRRKEEPLLISSVTYTAPYGLSIAGGNIILSGMVSV
jgi:hypothetical protein